MRRFCLFILFFLCVLSLSACDPSEPADPNTPEYPEGSIALTKENFTDYFTIRVTTDLSTDYIVDSVGTHKQTTATTYVAFVPKGDYVIVEGIAKFNVNAGITSAYPVSTYKDFSVVHTEQELNLDEEVVNDSYKLTVTRDADFYVAKDSNTITLNEVAGYLIDGKTKTPNAYESLTDDDRAASLEIKNQVQDLLLVFETSFADANSYNFSTTNIYEFKSLYGKGRDLSNLANYGKNKATVDLENKHLCIGLYNYYLREGELLRQRMNEYNLVEESVSAYSYEELLAEATPDFDNLFDTGAVYVRGEYDTTYYAYTTLKSIQNNRVKEAIRAHLENYGITTGWDKFVVKYTYYFVDGSFYFDATVTYSDPRYHVEYTDISVSYGFKVTDVNSANVSLYTPEKDAYALKDNLADAKKYLTGLVTIDSTTERVYFDLFQNTYNRPDSTEENFLPIRITESGLYEFTLSDGTQPYIFAEDGSQYQYYYPAGLYFLRYYGVPYGKTRELLKVNVTKLDDYADMENPIPTGNNTLEVYLESVKDKQAFLFVPSENGMYEFSETEGNVVFESFLASDYEERVSFCNTPYLSMYFEAGTSYIITVTHQTRTGEDASFSQTFTLTNVGDPLKEAPTLSDTWQEVFFGNGMFRAWVEIEKAGYYTVDFERTAGLVDPYGYLADEDGSSSDIKKVALEDGTQAYYLTEGRYLYLFSAMPNTYLVGNMRLSTKVLATESKETVMLSPDAYTTLSAYLPTVGSTATFFFTVPEGYHLLCPTSYFTTLYREDGTRVQYTRNNFYDIFFDRENCYQWANLTQGTYYIVLENINYSGESTTAEREFRLQATDEHEIQYYHMQACPELNREDITVLAYHGIYWGYRVALVEVGTYDETPHSETVAGYEFKYENANRLTVYKNGTIMTLSEMYENWESEALDFRDDAIAYFYERHTALFPTLYSE